MPSNPSNSMNSSFHFLNDPKERLKCQIMTLEETRKHHYEEATRLYNEWSNQILKENQIR